MYSFMFSFLPSSGLKVFTGEIQLVAGFRLFFLPNVLEKINQPLTCVSKVASAALKIYIWPCEKILLLSSERPFAFAFLE